MLTLGSLFDGIGGWQLAAIRAGIKPIWSSEIDRFPIAVTKKHFPNTLQLGDIKNIIGSKIPKVDIVTMGSPCQNLSIAGNREGFNGKESGLFKEAIRIIRELHSFYGGGTPRFIVWENVCGAFSSNQGMDFKSVLESLTETEIPMPKSGKWSEAGLVRSSKCEVAWRVLNSKYFGIPHDRKRVFLVADFNTGKRCSSEILFERKSVSGDIEESRSSEKELKRNVPYSSNESSKRIIPVYDISHRGDVVREYDGYIPTLSARAGTGGNNVPLVLNVKRGIASGKDCFPCLMANAATKQWLGNQEAFSGNYFILKKNVKLRRLTPLECERLQGLPDNFTLIDDKSCCDTARFKALGNGMCQPCPDFVLKRIVEHVS